MRSILNTPIDQILGGLWDRVDVEYKKACWYVVVVNLLAFGYEMTNLTLNHDDVAQILYRDPTWGYDLGRFTFGWLYYYGQDAHFMPFLQMFESIALMTAYGMLIAKLWGATKAADIVLIASVVSVFPFMAQIYSYNSAMLAYPLAHLLVAVAIFLSVKAKLVASAVAALLYVIALSIYQSVAAVAATIFLVWALARLLFDSDQQSVVLIRLVRSSAAVVASVLAGGLAYLAVLSAMDIRFETYQGADQAFAFRRGIDLAAAATEVSKGTRSFFFWPENYFPIHLKQVQLLFLAVTAYFCVSIPRTVAAKLLAGAVLLAALLAPRALQVLHPHGNYHNLTLTGYAVIVAGCVMVVNRAGSVLVRNLSIVVASGLIGGYVMQSNWISIVDHLNTSAHYSTMTQILTRIKSLPPGQWNGRQAVVVGSYEMPKEYPYRPAVGVAKEYVDAFHMQILARLMREEVTFVGADETTPAALEYAVKHSQWPHSDSIGVVNGVAVVVLSRKDLDSASADGKSPRN